MSAPVRWTVSPWATVSWRDGNVEIGDAGSDVVLSFTDVAVLQLIHIFARPRTVEEAIARLAPWPERMVAICVSDLAEAGILVGESVATAKDRGWDARSLAFHRSSRAPGTFPVTVSGPSEPIHAIAARRAATGIPLRPGPATRRRDLGEVLDARRSIRSWPARAIAFDDFSHLLWLGARNRAVLDEGKPSERVSRPYPSGGAAYSLELYPVLAEGAVAGLEAGVYRYLPQHHQLELLDTNPFSRNAFLESAARSAISERPPVVIAVTSRYGRAARHYGTLAYSLVLKEVGGLLQTLYLVAEYLGLAACALGAGVPDHLLGDLCGAGAHAEPVVGEFMLGPR